MCVRNSEEGCILSAQQKELQAKVSNMDSRLTKVENDVGKIRSEAQDGFRTINDALTNLAHDFGERMNNLDKRIIVEKEKWGETLRKILTWGAKALIVGALVAMGVNIANSIVKWFVGG